MWEVAFLSRYYEQWFTEKGSGAQNKEKSPECLLRHWSCFSFKRSESLWLGRLAIVYDFDIGSLLWTIFLGNRCVYIKMTWLRYSHVSNTKSERHIYPDVLDYQDCQASFWLSSFHSYETGNNHNKCCKKHTPSSLTKDVSLDYSPTLLIWFSNASIE